jgi:hypothetical protein
MSGPCHSATVLENRHQDQNSQVPSSFQTASMSFKFGSGSVSVYFRVGHFHVRKDFTGVTWPFEIRR